VGAGILKASNMPVGKMGKITTSLQSDDSTVDTLHGFPATACWES
jgi:hypothetical protein